MEALEALGIVESFSVASLIEGADAAVKAANVQLIEIRLAMALGGKAFVTLTGNVAAVQSAVDAGGAGGGAEGHAGQQSGDPASPAGIAERDDLGSSPKLRPVFGHFSLAFEYNKRLKLSLFLRLRATT